MTRISHGIGCLFAATIVAATTYAANGAEPETDTADPKAVTMIIGYPPGGGVDAVGRLVAQYLPQHLPGNPPVIARNMPGADGLVALNFFVRQVKPDGKTITVGSSVQLDPSVFRSSKAMYDPVQFEFLGGISRGGTFQIISKAAETRLLDKTQPPVAVGAVDGTRSGEQMSSWGMEFLDWNAKWVVGYRGANETSVALERGEVDLVSTSNSFLIKRLLDTGKFKLLSQSGIVADGKVRRRSDFPDTPVMAELVAGKLTTKGAREAFGYWESICVMDPWVSLPAGTPPAIVATYREAFRKMWADPEFLEKGKKISADIAPMTYSDIQELVKTAAQRLTPEAEQFIRAMHVKQNLRPRE